MSNNDSKPKPQPKPRPQEPGDRREKNENFPIVRK